MHLQKFAERAIESWFDRARLQRLGRGHIHDTYSVQAQAGRFVLQRVNCGVFKDPLQLTAQIQRVLRHWSAQADYRVPMLCPTKDGFFCPLVDGHYWRLWSYIEPSVVVDPIENVAQAERAGIAFAKFQVCLSSLTGPQLQPAIPDFFQLQQYLAAYDAVSVRSPGDLNGLINFHRERFHRLESVNTPIHGDCKIDNILFNAQRTEVMAIIDFDTVMYGHWAWDFGDLMRSIYFSRAGIDAEIFWACLKGFARVQTKVNVSDAVAAPGFVAFMLGVRFLTDHISGDQYFKVDQRGDNLLRAREQFELFASLQAHREILLAAAEAALR